MRRSSGKSIRASSIPIHSLTSYLRPSLLRALPYVLTHRSVHDVLGDYFTEERLKLAFTFQAKYLGMSPWHCPALFSILSFTEYRFGVYHVQGGLQPNLPGDGRGLHPTRWRTAAPVARQTPALRTAAT